MTPDHLISHLFPLESGGDTEGSYFSEGDTSGQVLWGRAASDGSRFAQKSWGLSMAERNLKRTARRDFPPAAEYPRRLDFQRTAACGTAQASCTLTSAMQRWVEFSTIAM